MCLVCVGVYIQSFNFEFRGLMGLVFEWLGMPTSVPYSLLSWGTDMPSSSPNPNDSGIRTLQVSFFTFTLGMPLVYLLMTSVLWLLPLPYVTQRRLFTLSEITYAWSAIDVFLVSIIAAILQLPQLTSFIVGDRCNDINAILEWLNPSRLGGDDKCMDVGCELNEGVWVLFVSSLLLSGVGLTLSRWTQTVLNARQRMIEDDVVIVSKTKTKTKEGSHRRGPSRRTTPHR